MVLGLCQALVEHAAPAVYLIHLYKHATGPFSRVKARGRMKPQATQDGVSSVTKVVS